MARNKIPRLLAVVLGVVLGTAACDLTGPGTTLEGTYRLESINSSPLPYEIFGAEILSGSITLRSDRTYTAESTTRYEDFETGQTVTEKTTETGTFSRMDNTVRLTSSEGEQIDATYAPPSLTINTGLFVAVYRKQ